MVTTSPDYGSELLSRFRAAYSEWNKYQKDEYPEVGPLLYYSIKVLERELTQGEI